MRGPGVWDSNPGFHNCEPKALPQSYSISEQLMGHLEEIRIINCTQL